MYPPVLRIPYHEGAWSVLYRTNLRGKRDRDKNRAAKVSTTRTSGIASHGGRATDIK